MLQPRSSMLCVTVYGGSEMKNVIEPIKYTIKWRRYNKGRKEEGVRVSTRKKREYIVWRAIKDLGAHGVYIEKAASLRGEHIDRLVNIWLQQGVRTTTITDWLSTLRVLLEKLGKRGMVKAARYYLGGSDTSSNEYLPGHRSWLDIGIDPGVKIEEVRKISRIVATLLELQWIFGLDVAEAMRLRPHLADKDDCLCVGGGTAKERTMPIDCEVKRAVLDTAKRLTASPDRSMIPQEFTLRQWCSYYYRVLDKCGIGRRFGITGHGLKFTPWTW